MKQKLHPAVLAGIALVLLVGLLPLGRVWLSSPRDPDGPLTPAARGIPSLEAQGSATRPAFDQGMSDAEENRREHLLLERRKLKQVNAALEDASQKAEAGKQRAEQSAEMMAELTSKLLDSSLKMPQTVSEAAALMGQDLADAAQFKKKWGGVVPPEGTPEAAEYAKEHEQLVGESAALMKFMSDKENAALLAQPGNLAQFKTVSLATALGLSDDQTQQIGAALNGYYQTFFSQGLNWDARPDTGIDAWNGRRGDLSQQAATDIVSRLTPEQATMFRTIYPHPQIWMIEVPLGGLIGEMYGN